ncbi:MAG: type III-A CRISPR-associated protein Csm2 [Paludibacteraceae bacterium]|nr:type III-A CRISPR-associated protein Csm2 [Paludibacteraceae bacterium]
MPELRDNNRFGSSRNNFPNNRSTQSSPEDIVNEWILKNICYKSSWIKLEADKDLVEFSEKLGHQLVIYGLTTSKIRNIYGEIKRIQVGGFEKNKPSFYLLKPKVAYALGRETDKQKKRGLILFSKVFNKAFNDVVDEITYHNFCNLMEAILAYHKANGGK